MNQQLEDNFMPIITYRSMIHWQWYRDIPVRLLFEHLLRIVALEPKCMRSIEVPVGGVLTSMSDLSHETGLTIRQIRLGLTKLESSHDVVISTFGKTGSLIMICHWESFVFAHDSESTSAR